MGWKYILFFTILSVSLFAHSVENLWQWYKNKQYDKVCSKQVALHDYYEYNKDENFINMYAHSCLKTDMINRLAIPIVQLRKSKQSRANATYYATILYQKKLLYQALVDGDILLPNNLPETNHIISKIYKYYVEKKYQKQGNYYIFQDNIDKNTTYKLFVQFDDGFNKIVIRTVQGNTVIKTRKYW